MSFSHVSASLDHIWRRLILELTPNYHQLNARARQRPEFRPGDVVLYMEAKDRGRWPLARIHEVEKSETDGRVRSVVLKFKNQLYRRSVNSILLLEACKNPQ